MDLIIGFVPIRYNTILINRISRFDLYIMVKDLTFGRVLAKGELLTPLIATKIQALGSEYVYVHSDQLAHYASEMLLHVERQKSSQIPGESNRIKLLTNAAEAVLTEFAYQGVSESSLINIAYLGQSLVDTLDDARDLELLLVSIGNIQNPLLRHSIGVAILAPLIAEIIGLRNRTSLVKLAIAGLIHDIGLFELPPLLWGMDPSELPENYRLRYLAHPERAKEILNSQTVLAPALTTLIEDHHIYSTEQSLVLTGSSQQPNPLARLVGFADLISHELFDSPNLSPHNLIEIYSKLESLHRDIFPDDHWNALKNLFQMDSKLTGLRADIISFRQS